jgi:hypothetical protein
MRATILNCTLKRSPERSNTAALADKTGPAAAQNLIAVAKALAQAPIPPPPAD